MIPNAKTFIVTIPRNQTRFDATMAHLKSHGVEPAVFTGVDGAISGLETSFGIDGAQSHDTPEIIAKWVSLYVSHFFLWKTCSYQPHDAFVILEDDVRLVDGWKPHLSKAMEHIYPEWDLLFVGSCCTADKDTKIHIADRLWEIKYANCTHAYAVRKKALPLLLDKLQRIHKTLDAAIALTAMPHLKCYAILPTICLQEGTILPP